MNAKTILEYKGYVGSVDVDVDSNMLHGLVQGINDVVHYQAATPQELEAAFRESVDDYLAMCKEDGVNPEKPYSGKFLVRIGEDLHRKAASIAAAQDISLNDFVRKAIEQTMGAPASDDVSGRLGFALHRAPAAAQHRA